RRNRCVSSQLSWSGWKDRRSRRFDRLWLLNGFLSMNRRNEAITTTGQRLNKPGIVAAVTKRRSHLREAIRQAAIEIDIRIAPNGSTKILLAYDFLCTRQQYCEDTCRLRLNRRGA